MKSDDPRQRLLGTWKLIAAVREEIPSGTKTDFLGSSPTGYINYAPDGRMMVLNVGNGRRKPVGANATPAEAEALFRSMTSYGGTYTIDGNEITHHVDVSWNETWTGTKQKRIARFEGNRVYLSTPPSPDPLSRPLGGTIAKISQRRDFTFPSLFSKPNDISLCPPRFLRGGAWRNLQEAPTARRSGLLWCRPQPRPHFA
jgi:hypothetical protein